MCAEICRVSVSAFRHAGGMSSGNVWLRRFKTMALPTQVKHTLVSHPFSGFFKQNAPEDSSITGSTNVNLTEEIDWSFDCFSWYWCWNAQRYATLCYLCDRSWINGKSRMYVLENTGIYTPPLFRSRTKII